MNIDRFIQCSAAEVRELCILNQNNMKRLIMVLVAACLAASAYAQSTSKKIKPMEMKMNAGIVTSELEKTRKFYCDILGFKVTFENDFYLLLHTPSKEAEISFLLPDHPSQDPLFHKPFQGQGMYLTIEVPDVDSVYADMKKRGVPVKIEIRDEPWGDRHFAIEDPNGIGIDIVSYSSKE
jgi:catechol 2,3-dioxygenase-like lactoylglutathione lyase family enzyme